MTNYGNPIISVRIPRSIKKAYRENADEIGIDMSSLLQNALIHYLDVHEDIELNDTVQKVVENQKEYKQAEDEEFFRQMESKIVRASYMDATYIEYMDNFLASLYMSNKAYYGEDELESIIQEHMTVLKRRAEHHGVLEEYEDRKQSPLSYAKEYVKRKGVENKAFNKNSKDYRTEDDSDE